MGEAKRRGTYEERVAMALLKRKHEEWVAAVQQELRRVALEIREAEPDQTPAWATDTETPTAS